MERDTNWFDVAAGWVFGVMTIAVLSGAVGWLVGVVPAAEVTTPPEYPVTATTYRVTAPEGTYDLVVGPWGNPLGVGVNTDRPSGYYTDTVDYWFDRGFLPCGGK